MRWCYRVRNIQRNVPKRTIVIKTRNDNINASRKICHDILSNHAPNSKYTFAKIVNIYL